MARLLIWNKNHGIFSVGDVISAVDDSHVFSEYEDKTIWIANGKDGNDWHGHTWVVNIPGVPVRKAKNVFERALTRLSKPGDLEYDPEQPTKKYLRHRKFQLDYSLVPSVVKSTLISVGKVTITKEQIINFIKNHANDGEVIDIG